MGNQLVRYADILAEGVRRGELSDYEAKLKFEQYQNQWNAQASAAEQRQGQALMQLGNQISNMGTNNTNRQVLCTKQGEYTEGFNKVCQYRCGVSAHAFTVRNTQLCPITVYK